MMRTYLPFHSLLVAVLLLPACATQIEESLENETGGVCKHLFILSGQSNMKRMHYDKDFTPFVREEFGANNIIVVWDAKGGKPISRWYKNWTSATGKFPKIRGDLYDRLIKKVESAIEGQKIKTITFIWMQGEDDARTSNGDVYGASLSGLVEQFEHDLQRKDINVVIGRISDFDLENKKYPHWTKVRNEQVRFIESYERGAWINTDDLNDGLDRLGNPISNDLHYSKIGYEILGRRFAETSIELVKKLTVNNC